MIYLTWFIMGIVYLLLLIVGCVYHITYLPYLFRVIIREKEIAPFWWFVNNTEPEVKGDRDWGDFGRFRPKNFWAFYNQSALRNPFHNLKITYLAPIGKGFRKIIDWEFWGITFHIEIGYGKTKYLYTFKTNLWKVILTKFKSKIMSEEKKDKKPKSKEEIASKKVIIDGDKPEVPPKG